MKGWIAFFSFMGLLSMVSAISGISQFTAEMGRGTTIAMHPNLLSRLFSGAEGTVFFLFAWAIYRRHRWIWRSVFYLFGAFLVLSVVDMFLEFSREYPNQPTGETMGYAGLAGLGFAIVGGYWSYLWYRRGHISFRRQKMANQSLEPTLHAVTETIATENI